IPNGDTITGIVAHSDMTHTGQFVSPNPMVNQLQHNIEWGQRGNYLEIPTDCPQRDERLGWMGDAQVFIRTGAYNFDIAAFMTKWIVDVVDGQSAEGCFPDVAPRGAHNVDGAPAWADAGIICPWTMYLCYGDTRILDRHYDSMARFIQYQLDGSKDFIRRERLNNNYGDWLNNKDDSVKELIATAFFAYSTDLMSRIARVLGKTGDVTKYQNLFHQIREAFTRTFWRQDGTLEGDTQTSYILAIYFNLLHEQDRRTAADRLVHLIEKRDWHLSTGFMGCSFINLVLSQIGRSDIAYRLLLNDTYPSWGYTIRYGATTMWERWDGWTHDKGFQDPGMNSFNHYSFGAVGDWLYRHVAGIDLHPDTPAYRQFIIKPELGGDFPFANANYDSIQGEIASSWRIRHDTLEMSVTVPPNCTALVYVPTKYPTGITESGGPVSNAPYVTFVRMEGESAIYHVDSGRYLFTSPLA
ncbi:MAG: rhamnosidase, partial [Candidatus Hydrogenedentota bacterium]